MSGPAIAPVDRRGRLARAIVRRLPLLGTVIGLVLGIWLVATNDLGAVADAFRRIGPMGLLAIVAVRVVVILLCGIAWARIVHGLAPVASTAFLVLRLVREGINVLLPVASVGGEVVGGRLLTFWGVAVPLAAASILVDMLLQVVSQVLFVCLGVVLLMQMGGEAAASLAAWTLRALVVTAALILIFFVFQRSAAAREIWRRLAARVGRLANPTSSDDRKSGRGGVYDALDAIWAPGRRWALTTSFLLHLAAWGLGIVEIWIALACIGVEGVSLTEIVVIETLSQAIKSAAFPVPSGLGVQEGGFVLLGALFGIDAGTALALSLVKRVPDVVLGLPALVLWQMLEARRATIVPPRS